MSDGNIVVVGAGVAGLTTAYLLCQNPRYKVTVVAKHMPGDYDIEYASPWAGANYHPVSVKGTRAADWDRNTWPELERLARNHPEAGVHFQEEYQFNRKKDAESATGTWLAEALSSDPWYKDIVPNFRKLSSEELPPGTDTAFAYTSVCINTAIYLPWLVSQCLAKRVVFKRAVLKHISEAAHLHHSGKRSDVLINCTGLMALKLGGVNDEKMLPARGQTVLVRNDPGIMCANSGTDDGEDEVCYIMQRAAGGGTILGGCYQKGNWDSQFDPNLATRIMKRAVQLCPALTDGQGFENLDVVRHNVGLRPFREGGARLETEKIDGVWTIHNYGHSGYGYQSSYGCSQEVVKLTEQVLCHRAKL